MTVSTFNCPKCPDGIISSSDKDRLCEYTALPSLNVSYVDNVCHLTNLDADLNMPVDSNFSYSTFHDFQSNFDISECLSSKQAFSLLHSNIGSLSGNFEDFTTMLAELYFPFSVIGLSESKIKFGEQTLINIDLPGYTFVSQNTPSNAGVWGSMLEMILPSLCYPSFHVQLLIMKPFGLRYKIVMATILFVVSFVDTQMII